MAHWLFKSEPSVWSFEMQVGEGAKGTDWSGIRNHSAKLNMMAMKKGDKGFFYHSNEGKAVVGIVEVIKAYHPDPTNDDRQVRHGRHQGGEITAEAVTLEAIKAEKARQDGARHQSRLSVQPVTDEEWKIVSAMAGCEAERGRSGW